MRIMRVISLIPFCKIISLVSCSALLGLFLMWEFPPMTAEVGDWEQITLNTFYDYMDHGPPGGNEFYLSFDGRDPGNDVLEEIRKRYPGIIFHPDSENTEYGQCSTGIVGDTYRCKLGAVVHAEALSILMRWVALAHAGSWHCGGDHWLFKFFGRWVVFSRRVGCA
ncbi:hypothetical protein [Nitrospirillum sp. BR 11828]|uniref:hypothetical protein n=1 Tax=Nitrospirillum sp. BR 11828 TaxID=3104325 RepID=UPI002ACA937F|nr:hypothetical protein [Nitrospirillum sp. BR 11828]MDZ5647793.1 hypothetical protein [Nitrospirillum sp. BR 11828]